MKFLLKNESYGARGGDIYNRIYVWANFSFDINTGEIKKFTNDVSDMLGYSEGMFKIAYNLLPVKTKPDKAIKTKTQPNEITSIKYYGASKEAKKVLDLTVQVWNMLKEKEFLKEVAKNK